MEFNKRLIELRKSKGLYQADVAKHVGVARATYGAYEQGNRQPDFDTLQSIANFFEVSTDYLLGRTSTIQEPSSSYDLPVLKNSPLKNFTDADYLLLQEIKKHPVLFNELSVDPEKKVREIVKLHKMKKLLLEDDEELGDGFGDLKD